MRWLAGLTLIVTSYIVYAYFGGLVESTLPTTITAIGVHQYGSETLDMLKTSFKYGVLLCGCAGGIYIIFAGLPGQTEETYI